jgi:nucleoside-diphosphate-sugar epimerase
LNFTIIGASGFIGSALAARLQVLGQNVFAPQRGDAKMFASPLGHVIYAAGITADFRSRPFDTLRANTSLLAELLERANFESLLYLSSARIYRHAEHSREDAAICLRSKDPEDLYDLTKLTAEAICYSSNRKSVRIVRLTNVVGEDFRSQNFLVDVIRSACDVGCVELRSTLDSEKDYVLLRDVLNLLPEIAVKGYHSCYNFGSGHNLTHAELLAPILAETGARLRTCKDARRIVIPSINIDRLSNEFSYQPSPVLPYIPQLIHEYRKSTCNND